MREFTVKIYEPNNPQMVRETRTFTLSEASIGSIDLIIRIWEEFDGLQDIKNKSGIEIFKLVRELLAPNREKCNETMRSLLRGNHEGIDWYNDVEFTTMIQVFIAFVKNVVKQSDEILQTIRKMKGDIEAS